MSLFLILLLPSVTGRVIAQPVSGFDPAGLWYARLSPTPDNPVEFQVRIAKKGSALAATLINGTASEPFSDVVWDGTALTLEMAHHDAKIVATPKDGNLEGMFTRIAAAGAREFGFSASRTAPPPVAVKRPGVSVSGTWAAEIARPGESPEKVTALLAQKGAAVTGTMVTASGDYGPLHGTFDGEELVLTVFNGIFVNRFTAELLPDGTLVGEYRSGKNPPVDWRARRKPPDPAVPGATSIGIRWRGSPS